MSNVKRKIRSERDRAARDKRNKGRGAKARVVLVSLCLLLQLRWLLNRYLLVGRRANAAIIPDAIYNYALGGTLLQI